MTSVVLAVVCVALLHGCLLALQRRLFPVPTAVRWLWSVVVVAVAVVALWERPWPAGVGAGIGRLWPVVVVDLLVLLAVIAWRDRPAGEAQVERRRLLTGVVAAGALAAAAGAAARPLPVAPVGMAGGRGTGPVDPLAHGAVPDYTGRYHAPGEGTDSRAGIQAALDAASDVAGTDYYGYIGRRSTTVTLPPGQYLVSATGEDASLVVPPGCVLDASAATLYFDYPDAPATSWCGIRVGQYGQLVVGKLYPSGRTAPPDGELVYDAVRLVQTDDNSRIIGYGDSEIRGWQGAAIRGVGAWLVYVKGLRLVDS